MALFDGHFNIRKCSFAERSKFHSAIQSTNETLADWAARVRGLAMHCGFSAGYLTEALRDRFVLGMRCGAERDRLFSELMEELTLEKALQIAESVHCAREGARQAAAVAGGLSGPSLIDMAGPSYVDVHKMAERPGTSESTSNSKSSNKCYVCGYYGHNRLKCKFKNYVCQKCGIKGHLKRACSSEKGYKQNFLQFCPVDNGNDDGKKLLFNLRSYDGEPMRESVVVDQISLMFEVDTGSAVTAISDATYIKYFSKHPLRNNNKILQSYNGSLINTVGVLSLPFLYNDMTQQIDVFVVKDGGPPLLGRDFINKFNLQICQINSCETVVTVKDLLKNYSGLFSNKLGCCKDIEVSLTLKPDSKPIFCKARPVPFALRNKIEQEIDRLVNLGILEPVTFSDYASPVVPVLKHNGELRLCADYSVTINKQLVVEKYPLPRVNDLFMNLHGGIQFSTLDLSAAYFQLKLNKESQLLTCINTHKGLYKYTRLVFGLSSAPAIFQRTLEKILSGIDGVLQFLDDILVTGKNREEHMSRLKEVFTRLQKAGLLFNFIILI